LKQVSALVGVRKVAKPCIISDQNQNQNQFYFRVDVKTLKQLWATIGVRKVAKPCIISDRSYRVNSNGVKTCNRRRFAVLTDHKRMVSTNVCGLLGGIYPYPSYVPTSTFRFGSRLISRLSGRWRLYPLDEASPLGVRSGRFGSTPSTTPARQGFRV
jgi:hypothetical protein